MLAQVSNQGNVGNQNGDVVNENFQENVGNVIVNGNRVGCSYKEFLACNPKEYDGKGGAVVLTRWIEKMESVHDMSGCSIDQKVKYTAGSFVGKALTWWNSQIHTRSREIVVGMSWDDFKVLMRKEFCPSNEMQKLETKCQKELNMRQRRWIKLFSDYDCEIRYHPGIKDKILAAQKEAVDEFAGLQRGLDEMIEQRSDGTLYYLDRIWVPLKGEGRTLIMDEAHKSKYYDLRDRYWWPGMKKDIAKYVSKCLTSLKVKAEHQRPSGLLQQHEIPVWKWEGIAMNFVTKLPRTSSGHDTIWIIMDLLIQIMSKNVIYIFRPLDVLMITKCENFYDKIKRF
ncbi:putative reverse transcriptase domain-containing protein [Tanacetum coccineum]